MSGIGSGFVATASADPAQEEPPAVSACKQFDSALRVSSTYYNKFAYSIAGDGAQVDYRDPAVVSDNVDGRTALRKSAAEAMIASSTS